MAKTMAGAKVQDPEGIDWHRRASDRWNRYMERARGDGEAAVDAWSREPEPLPDFQELAAPTVTRQVLGRFLEDRATGTVHDAYAANTECDLDGIQAATFWHFWSEVLEGVPEGVPCEHCIP